MFYPFALSSVYGFFYCVAHMLAPADYHMHTPLCRHATGEPTDYAAQAVRIGLREIGFSDHSPTPRDDFDDWRMRSSDLDDYVAKVEKARRDYPQLVIRLGLEVDYLPGCEDWVRQLEARHPWDYFIGSVHYVSEAWAVDNPHLISKWKNRDPLEVWEAYCQRLTQAAGSGLFDIIGHVDLCKKFRFYPQSDTAPLFKSFINTASAKGVAIELNTAGLRKDCREIYPSVGILKLAREADIPITFGSDAHAPEEVGMQFNEAADLARSCGYTETCYFDRRRRELRLF
jgi:histidinol-phosphatase (PHP family)